MTKREAVTGAEGAARNLIDDLRRVLTESTPLEAEFIYEMILSSVRMRCRLASLRDSLPG